MKTRYPLILTARIAEDDLLPFDALRQKHFPPDRNLLRAHLTMFHRLPGEYTERIVESLRSVAMGKNPISAPVSGIRHLGAGVAFAIESPALNAVRDILHGEFIHWLGPQDMQAWRPHITIQNKVARAVADSLHRELANGFEPHDITIVGLDLWRYLDGPWARKTAIKFG